MKSSTINYAAVAVIIIVLSAAVLVGIALAVYFTWPAANDQATGTVQVRLTGNFTILNREVPDVSDASICVYLTGILTSANIATSNCTIIDKSPWTVKVRYSLEFSTNLSADVALKTASTAIAKSSSDASIFHIDQNSITFEDSKGNVQKYCTNQTKTLCHNNSVCISVVGGYECVCNVGYSQSTGICAQACNTTFQYGCLNGRCIVTEWLCDGFNDCPEGDDERAPQCNSRFCKSLNTWIPTTKVCDKFQDCPDDSDEVNCICNTTFQYGCLNGRCIYKEWLCDGVNDCPEGDDERAPQCINLRESSANDSNIRLLNATYRGISGYHVCSDGWIDSWSNSMCKQMGYGNATATSSQKVNDGIFVSFDPTQSSSSNLAASISISNCSSLNAVGIRCASLECGKRAVLSDSFGPYILNGQRAARGAWPWQVIVRTGKYNGAGQFFRVSICGGSLLNDRWVLTAAHCAWIDNLTLDFGYIGPARPGNLQIVLGTISRLDNPDAIEMRVDQVHVHPNYSYSIAIVNDVALLRLNQPVTMGETVQPICLPGSNQDLDLFRVCVDTGFGRTIRNTASNDLLQARMNIIPGSNCSAHNRFLRDETQLCIGTLSNPPDINLCSGDSGGPLSCQNQNGAWLLIGVNSYVLGNNTSVAASDVCRLSVVARVTAFLDWIGTTMATLKPQLNASHKCLHSTLMNYIALCLSIYIAVLFE